MQKVEVIQGDVNQYVANGGSLRTFTEDQIKAIPQQIVNQRAANSGNLTGFTKDQKKAIPQDDINKRAANGGSLEEFTEDKIKVIPQENINQRVAKYGYSENRGRYLDGVTEDQIKAIPEKLKKPDYNMINALTLYANGEIKKEDLPLEVFANCETRRKLIWIVRDKNIEKFNKLCKEKGYLDNVPDELKARFDERCKEFEKEIKAKIYEAVKYLTEERKKQDEIIDEMGW